MSSQRRFNNKCCSQGKHSLGQQSLCSQISVPPSLPARCALLTSCRGFPQTGAQQHRGSPGRSRRWQRLLLALLGVSSRGRCQRRWGWGELKHCKGCCSIGLGQRAPVAGDCGSGCGTAAVTLNEWGRAPSFSAARLMCPGTRPSERRGPGAAWQCQRGE